MNFEEVDYKLKNEEEFKKHGALIFFENHKLNESEKKEELFIFLNSFGLDISISEMRDLCKDYFDQFFYVLSNLNNRKKLLKDVYDTIMLCAAKFLYESSYKRVGSEQMLLEQIFNLKDEIDNLKNEILRINYEIKLN